jgi:hypothetical protein
MKRKEISLWEMEETVGRGSILEGVKMKRREVSVGNEEIVGPY